VLQESPLKSSSSSQGPQTNEGDVPGGTDRLDRCRKVEHCSSGDAESSRDMRIRPLEEDIALFGYSLC
jgi:hypothetical protein